MNFVSSRPSADTMPCTESSYARKTRARILAAAERRFKHYGYAKTTIVDIAADCAMSNANVYRFYKSKADLVDAIAGGLIIKCERVCREVVSRPISARARLIEFMVELYRWKRQEHSRNPRMHELLAVATDEGRAFVTDHLNVLGDLLVEIILDGKRKREFVVSDAPLLAHVIQDATVKFIDPRLVAWHDGEDLEERLRNVMTTIVESLGPPDRRR
jgi:AcrR family transcriptional regulator